MDRSAFLDARELATLRDEIAASGFERDPLAAELADRACIGLNLGALWPLPSPLAEAYAAFEARARALDPGLYVYPYSTTHVTLLTAINFKRHPEPDAGTLRAVDEASTGLGDFASIALAGVAAFDLDVGPPALARAAAFLPMRDPSGSIAKLRERALAYCHDSGDILSHASAPRAVHSTVLRFREAPDDPLAFARAFDDVARDFPVTRVTVREILITLETKPYMREGRIARRIRLR